MHTPQGIGSSLCLVRTPRRLVGNPLGYSHMSLLLRVQAYHLGSVHRAYKSLFFPVSLVSLPNEVAYEQV
jgi:hypothetical protein